MPLKRCQQEIDSREFELWKAEYSIAPWGELRGDLHAAIVAQTVAAGVGVKLPLADFMPSFGEELEDGEGEEDPDRLTAKLLRAFGIQDAALEGGDDGSSR